MALRPSKLQHYYNTIWSIAASPWVSEYIVGYTRRPPRIGLESTGRYMATSIWS